MGARILLTRPDHLGDVLLTLPAARAVRSSLPDAQLSYLVGPGGREITARCPAVDRTLELSFQSLQVNTASSWWRSQSQREGDRLAGEFDIAVIVRPDDPWTAAIAQAAGIPVRVGFGLPRTRPFLTDALPEPGRRHAVDMALDVAAVAVEKVGVAALPACDMSDSFQPTDDDRREAEALVARAGWGERVALLHPGSGWPLKNWPVQRWGSLARQLADRLGLAVFVAGGPDETQLVHDVVAASGGTASVLPTPSSFGALAVVQGRARVVIATDSGASQLAAFAGAPVIALFGPADHLVFAPRAWSSAARVMRVELPCSPCGTLEHPPCGALAEPACVLGVTVEAVLQAVADLLANREMRVCRGI